MNYNRKYCSSCISLLTLVFPLCLCERMYSAQRHSKVSEWLSKMARKTHSTQITKLLCGAGVQNVQVVQNGFVVVPDGGSEPLPQSRCATPENIMLNDYPKCRSAGFIAVSSVPDGDRYTRNVCCTPCVQNVQNVDMVLNDYPKCRSAGFIVVSSVPDGDRYTRNVCCTPCVQNVQNVQNVDMVLNDYPKCRSGL
jgi:hypothetical protein